MASEDYYARKLAQRQRLRAQAEAESIPPPPPEEPAPPLRKKKLIKKKAARRQIVDESLTAPEPVVDESLTDEDEEPEAPRKGVGDDLDAETREAIEWYMEQRYPGWKARQQEKDK
jgi:hypothetical protein